MERTIEERIEYAERLLRNLGYKQLTTVYPILVAFCNTDEAEVVKTALKNYIANEKRKRSKSK